MFSALIEKLQRREDLTVDEASAAMGEIMDGRAASAQIAGLLIALAMKGERPSEVVGLARTMRAARRTAVEDIRSGVRHLRHGRRSIPHLQRVDGVGAGRGGIGSARRQTRQPVGLEPVRQRGSFRGARREHQRPSACRGALSGRSGHRVLSGADISSFDAPCRADSQRARRPHGVQSARPVDEPGWRLTPARGRAPAGADGTGRTLARAARVGTSVGRARCRRPRRDLDDRLHEDLRMPGWIGEHVLPPSVRRANPEGVARGRCVAAARTTTRGSPGTFWRARPAHHETSFCSTQARRSSLPAPSAACSDGLVRAADALDSGRAADVLATLVRVSNASPEVARG